MQLSRLRTLIAVMFLLGASTFVLLTFLQVAESKIDIAAMPMVPPQIETDVIHYEFDLLKVTSNWPKSLSVENVSDKQVSGFELLIFAANDDGGPGETISWGRDPNYGTQSPMFKPGETINLDISTSAVKKFQNNGKPFLYIEVFRVFTNNDPKFLYSEGAFLEQDQGQPGTYHVIKDAKGRAKVDRGHAMPHITHSVKPPFPLGCCTREFYQSVTYDCNITDSCDPQGRKCQITNNAYTVCTQCCPNQQAISAVPCHHLGMLCQPLLCDESQLIAHNTPCTCCNC